jgi:hypothetical protein
MALNFPNSPTDGQIYTDTSTGYRWVWDSGNTTWKSTSTYAQTITVSSTQPGSPVIGQLWWNNDYGRLFVYYSDGDSSQWVDASPNDFNAVAAFRHANAGFTRANTALQNTTGTFAGTLSTSGGISVTGNMASISPSSIGVYLGRDSGAANNAGIDISCSPTGYGWLDFNNSSSIDYKGRIGYDIGNDIMHLVTNGIIRQQIDSVGRVTKPYQPAFWIEDFDWSSSTQRPHNGYVRYNIGNHYNNTNGYFTAPITGRYMFICTVQGHAPNETSGRNATYYNLKVNINGVDIGNEIVATCQDSVYGKHSQITYPALVVLNANDVFYFNSNYGFRVVQNSYVGYLLG